VGEAIRQHRKPSPATDLRRGPQQFGIVFYQAAPTRRSVNFRKPSTSDRITLTPATTWGRPALKGQTEAIRQFQEALRIRPDFAYAKKLRRLPPCLFFAAVRSLH
jgi:hypothetical protein